MKKYLLGISLGANIILLVALVTVAFMLFNLKAKVDTAIQQVKDGEYIELAKENMLPDSLKIFPKLMSQRNLVIIFIKTWMYLSSI